jgi:hypothetical protein
MLGPVDQFAVRANLKIRDRSQCVIGITEDLSGGFHAVEVEQDGAKRRHDLFAPDEQIEIGRDLVIVAAVDIGETLFDPGQAVPGIALLVEGL